jgi:hypothetical protein
MEIKHYSRSREQDKILAIYEVEKKNEMETINEDEDVAIDVSTQDKKAGATLKDSSVDIDDWKLLEANNEVLEFTTNCSNCNAPCFTNMKVMSKWRNYFIHN